MDMLNSLNILAGKISPQNHDETTGAATQANGAGDRSPSGGSVARYCHKETY